MPLFHSNAVQVGWAPSIVVRRERRAGPEVLGVAAGCATSATTARPTSTTPASRWATCSRSPSGPTTPTTRCGSRSATRARRRWSTTFARRFGVDVIDAYGATEGGVAVNRDAEERAGALGLVGAGVQGRRRRRAPRSRGPASTRDGRLANADECVGEIVNTAGVGPVRGLLQQRRGHREARRASAGTGPATSATSTTTATSTSPVATPTGSGSTARTSRPARSRTRCAQHPDVVLGAVYGVPDEQAGDQVMASLVLRDGASFDPARSRAWVDGLDGRRPEVAAALRPGAARPADDGHEQDREAHARAPEVAPRPGRRRRGLRARAAARTRTARSPPTTRHALAGRVRRAPAASGSGTSEWTSASPPRSGRSPTEIRGWLADQPRAPARRSTRSTTRSRGGGRGRRSSPPTAGSGSTGRPSTAAGARRRCRSRSTTWSTPGRARCSR